MNMPLVLFTILGLTCFLVGLQTLAFYPLSLLFALQKKRPPVFRSETPLVSVVVPAYNEAKVLGRCVNSILASHYRHVEIILVDDGSTDATWAVMQRTADHPRVTAVRKPNGGKASALNVGLARAQGEVVCCVDADTVFRPDTLNWILAAFDAPDVGAVCGHDSPANLNTPRLQLAALQAHVSTGFVRRALSVLDALPIVSGNVGAYRRAALAQTGGFHEGILGEDLELTWRTHKAGWKVRFQPRARVVAESPPTLRGLWKQRVRWTRGLIQTVRLHPDLPFNPRYDRFGLYLGLNLVSMLLVPLLQLASLLLLPLLLLGGQCPIPPHLMDWAGWLGLGFALVASVYSVALDGDWGDLRFLYTVPLWVPYSLFVDLVVLWGLWLELRGASMRWNKLERVGVLSRWGGR